MNGSDGSDEAFRPVRARVDAEIAAAFGEIDQAPDDETAYRRATWLTERYRQATIAGGEKRAGIAARIRDTGKLSLAALGNKIGVSKARAAQIMQPGKRKDPPA